MSFLTPGLIVASGIYSGIAVKTAITNLSSEHIGGIRNRLVINAVRCSAAAVLTYYYLGLVPLIVTSWKIPIFGVFSHIGLYLSEYCLYLILFERLFPLFRTVSNLSHTTQNMLKMLIATILTIPMLTTTIAAIFNIKLPADTYISYTVSNFVTVAADVALSAIFLAKLLENRQEGTILALVLQNKLEWAQIIGSLALSIVVFLIRFISLMVPAAISVYSYVGFLYPLLTLQMFTNYLITTSKVTKDILKTNLTTGGHGGKNDIINTRVNTTSVA